MENKQNQTPKYIYNNYYRGVNRQPYQLQPKPKKSKKLKVFITFLVLILIGFGSWHYLHTPKKDIDDIKKAIVKPKPESENQPHVSAADQAALASMKSQVNAIIQQNSNITFEVAINNINNGDQYNFGQSGPMTAASVAKILTATDYFDQVEDGNLTMDETLDDGNTADVDMQSMIVVSSDTAWQALEDQLTPNQIQDYANNLGITSFNYGDNTLSARDTADLMTSLYQGSLINSSDTQLLLGYLKQANYRNFILPAIPSTDTVYHKVGFYTDNVNDATIITNGKQTISLVIFTNGNGAYDWTNRAILMQEITKPILEYFKLN